MAAATGRPSLRLASRKGAVYGEHRTRHPLRVVRREEERGFGDIFSGADTRPRGEVVKQLVGIVVFKEGTYHRRGEKSGADCVHVDSLGCEVEREFTCQIDDRSL